MALEQDRGRTTTVGALMRLLRRRGWRTSEEYSSQGVQTAMRGADEDHQTVIIVAKPSDKIGRQAAQALLHNTDDPQTTS